MGELNMLIQVLLTAALVRDEWSALRPSRLTSGECVHGNHWIGGWMGPRTGLDDVERSKILNLSGLELSDPSVLRLVASHYTDCCIPVPSATVTNYN
jgi:hypothetical protein